MARETIDLGDLLSVRPAEVAQFDQTAFEGSTVARFERASRASQEPARFGREDRRSLRGLTVCAQRLPPVLAGVVDEDLAHQPRATP